MKIKNFMKLSAIACGILICGALNARAEDPLADAVRGKVNAEHQNLTQKAAGVRARESARSSAAKSGSIATGARSVGSAAKAASATQRAKEESRKRASEEHGKNRQEINTRH